MTRNRSVTNRNLLGGLVGGMLGVLCFGYIGSWTLPAGTLIGVLVGWWYEDIYAAIQKELRRTEVFFKNVGIVLGVLSRVSKIVMSKGLDGLLLVLMFCFFAPLVVLGSPFIVLVIAWRQLKGNADNQRRVLCTISMLMFLLAHLLWLYPLWMFIAEDIHIHVSINMNWVLTAFGLTCLAICPIIILWKQECDPVTSRSHNLEYYTDHGWKAYMLRTLYCLLRGECEMVRILLFEGYFSMMGMAVIFVVLAIPLAVVVGIAKGLYAVSMRKGHILCLIVTLVVATTFAYFMHTQFFDQRILWITAMIAGLAAALITEVVRVSMHSLLQGSRIESYAVRSCHDHFSPFRQACGWWKNLIEQVPRMDIVL